MRYSAFLGSVLAAVMSHTAFSQVATAIERDAIAFPAIDDMLRSAPQRNRQSKPARPARTQRHTGAGGAGMHRAAKRRRASGRV